MSRPSTSQIIKAKFKVQNLFGEEIEQYIASKFEDLNKLRDQFLPKLSSSSDEEFLQVWNEIFPRYIALEFAYPKILRTSILVSSYFLFEDTLKQLCKQIETNLFIKTKINDLKGNVLSQARLFLEGDTDLSFPDHESLWEDVDNIRQLRNCLAHNNGLVGWKDSKLSRIVHGHEHLDLDEAGGIVLGKGFNLWAFGRLEELLLNIASFADASSSNGAYT